MAVFASSIHGHLRSSHRRTRAESKVNNAAATDRPRTTIAAVRRRRSGRSRSRMGASQVAAMNRQLCEDMNVRMWSRYASLLPFNSIERLHDSRAREIGEMIVLRTAFVGGLSHFFPKLCLSSVQQPNEIALKCCWSWALVAGHKFVCC